MALDTDALICDIAETYHIYDMRSMPVSKAAVFASGLGVNSRIRLKMEGLKAPWEVVLMAKAIDLLSAEGSKSLVTLFLIDDKENKMSEFRTFASIEEFEQAKAEIIGGSITKEERVYGGN